MNNDRWQGKCMLDKIMKFSKTLNSYYIKDKNLFMKDK